MSRHFRVLQLQPDYNVKDYDCADLAEQIIKALPTDRYEVTATFLRGRPGPTEPVSRAAKSAYFELSNSALKGLRLRAMWQLYKFCRREKFDVVICNRFKPVNMMLQLNRWLKIPLCIGISHGFGEYDRLYRRKQVQCWLDEHWHFIGVSPAVTQYLLNLKCGFTYQNTHTIKNAIDIKQSVGLQHSRKRARELLGINPTVRLIGALGRLVPVKGHTYLVQAFAALKDQYPTAQLAIIGTGREKSHLITQIQDLGLAGRVQLLGFKENALQYVQAFNIWAIPSLSEGSCLALLEGMSGRLPVIASSVPAMLPLIQSAGGLAVNPANVSELTMALDAYLALSDEALARKGEQAYRCLQAQHDIMVFRKEYLELIDSKLAQACGKYV
ncbi:glycosyltransferase [Candidatus Pseudomonas adelgestsugas]|uniref:GDP-mannose-dependent alpha-(1-6)-phosphatidylinositol monomannoside mannosyltransferase n=1 Tax=Candidatus Pseudomonas adelgestsugas TaxID=1302376 RepID=A0ABX5R8Q8_9PSED|nr:glycosyltransferase [Candidatus Pseudomonas adelgestsugas]QAX81570.1 GDP-mannose-dependent alpha-(1-6)-phosphatidylinositol monomannoside mannosyltransferase [Candidatus Pseudomonas adelgestsugas]